MDHCSKCNQRRALSCSWINGQRMCRACRVELQQAIEARVRLNGPFVGPGCALFSSGPRGIVVLATAGPEQAIVVRGFGGQVIEQLRGATTTLIRSDGAFLIPAVTHLQITASACLVTVETYGWLRPGWPRWPKGQALLDYANQHY